MNSVWCNLRLAIGCWGLFAGVLMVGVPPADAAGDVMVLRWWGVVVGGAGLAITLREFAFMIALFARAKDV